ncbi:hypothetical protein BDV96DRAFT_591314 [Lophiotrema nucula]|uniref:Uncharacterized protein n=1 Tax=Lophiotrema nucula TaxID=690887 RepID=A0A6A5YHH1_9PLEO|nr:hypothetical protein BDV96DRAFT_591314 [Lophiotrema nucula]
MKAIIALSTIALAKFAIAAPDPAITARAQLVKRQDDPAMLGWVSTSGASEFSNRQTCDFPATLSTSGSYAQCCAPSSACNFWTTCSNNAVVAASTSVFCDNGLCNTGVIVPTTGAKEGTSYLGCWATSLGQDPFTMVQDIGSAPVATPTGGSSSGPSSGATSGASSRASGSGSGSVSETASATGSATAAASSSTGAAIQIGAKPLGGLLGFVAGLFALL